MFKNLFLNFALFSLSMFFFRCDPPKEISETEFKNLIREASDSYGSNEFRSIKYLGVENEKAVLKVSTPSVAGSKRDTEEFFYAKATPSLIIWIDENLYKITVPNFKKLYHYIQLQENKQKVVV
ncbi:hypothetical protein [Leptospira borgpetersenii]|uniref:Lipoprotein n=1 Tax=Leptospira borgpetersenii str. Brem 328 TaxID=1049780 RepID=A0ABC9SKN9_LEPBO|nr:hypothetical protein [Leptospira borgpetersenii]EMN14696.1 hypothetical protein LEP1GSC055_0248 [Leptospira borgpetersenii str. Brem 307]EMN18342.1 hypothetical protein LEP1GSC056_0655 [Leptospira borgpetersenii str. Brem 328]